MLSRCPLFTGETAGASWYLLTEQGGCQPGALCRWPNAAMEVTPSYRPRVSRETRLLLTAVLGAVVALWVLARVRFPDLSATSNPVAPLLSQLATTPSLDSLASEISQLQTRLDASLLRLDPNTLETRTGGDARARDIAALRLRDDLAFAVADEPMVPGRNEERVAAIDPASGIVVVRVPGLPQTPALTPWVPRRLERPQYLAVTESSPTRIVLKPVFVAALEPVATALWPEPVWEASPAIDAAVGAFVFTAGGDFVGAVGGYGDRQVIFPAAAVAAEVERLLKDPSAAAGDLGIEVQPLTPDLAAATGASSGVVVAWAERGGANTTVLTAGDVIEAIDGQAISTADDWRVRTARARAGESLTLRIRRRGESRETALLAPANARPAAPTAELGLRLRRAPPSGTEILAVEPGSAADRGGLAVGDVITLAGEISSPTPDQLRRLFASAREGRPVLVGVTRGVTHLVTTLAR
jgi:PDZ domain